MQSGNSSELIWGQKLLKKEHFWKIRGDSRDGSKQSCCSPPAPPNQQRRGWPQGWDQPHISNLPLISRGHFFGWLNPNVGVPLAGREDNDFIQKLIYAGDQVFSIPGFVGDIAEELGVERGEVSAWEGRPATHTSHVVMGF